MPLTLLEELWDGQETELRQEFREVAPGSYIQERQHVRNFLYETDTQLDSTVDILTQALAFAPPLPPVGSVHPDDPNATLWTYTVQRDAETAHHGKITANYSTQPNPVNEPARVDYGEGSQERIFEGAEAFVFPDGSEDVMGPTSEFYPDSLATDPYPITNSAYCPFTPPPTDQEPYLVLTIKKNLSLAQWTPWAFLQNYVRRINSVTYTVKGQAYPPGTVFLCKPPTASEQFDRNTAVNYYQTTWTFWVREKGWNLRLQDMGYRELVNPDDPTEGDQPIYGELSGQPVAEPAKLDGAGSKLTPQTKQTVVLGYRVRKKADFHLLPLGI